MKDAADAMSHNIGTRDDLLRTLRHSVQLVKSWGGAQVRNGATVAEVLTLDGVPVWDVIAANLAYYHVPKLLLTRASRNSPIWRLRRVLSSAKRKMIHLMNARKTQSCVPWRSPTILFLGFSAYIYRDVLQPVAARLREGDGPYTPVVLYDPRNSRQSAVIKQSNELHSIWEHWDEDAVDYTKRLTAAVRHTVHELMHSRVFQRIFEGQGGLNWLEIKDTLDWIFSVDISAVTQNAAAARHIFNRHQPSLVVSADPADVRSRVYTLLAAAKQIPSLEVQFGTTGPDSIEWQFSTAKWIAVWGQRCRESLAEHGVPQERIVVTGSPRYDVLGATAPELHRSRSAPRTRDEAATIVLASVYNLPEYEAVSDPKVLLDMKQALLLAAERVSGIRLIVKPHPWEDVREIMRLGTGSKRIQFADSRMDIRELIMGSDAFITFGTTATFSALAAKKLVICPVFPGWIWGSPFPESGTVLVPRSQEEIEDCFRIIADKEALAQALRRLELPTQEFLRGWLYQTDGRAAQRIEELAVQIARNAKASPP